MRSITRKHLTTAALALGAAGSLTMALTLTAWPAHAQITVFDPGNYSQNVLTAARTLQQISNQIQSLQNEATMILNQARNLSRIDFPELERLREKMGQIDRLMGQAQGIDFRVDQLDERFRQLFPDSFGRALQRDQRVREARARLGGSMDAFRHTMTVQAQVVENVRGDITELDAILLRSQGAEGALQASQATNQLLALTAKQQFQLQQMMAAQFRSEAVEQARRAQEAGEARAATKRFLGSGRAWTPPLP